MSKKNKIQRKQQKQQLSQIKAQRGLDRQHFIETNGDMKQWRPPVIVVPDKKKRKNKRACRGKYRG